MTSWSKYSGLFVVKKGSKNCVLSANPKYAPFMFYVSQQSLATSCNCDVSWASIHHHKFKDWEDFLFGMLRWSIIEPWRLFRPSLNFYVKILGTYFLAWGTFLIYLYTYSCTRFKFISSLGTLCKPKHRHLGCIMYFPTWPMFQCDKFHLNLFNLVCLCSVIGICVVIWNAD